MSGASSALVISVSLETVAVYRQGPRHCQEMRALTPNCFSLSTVVKKAYIFEK